MASHRTTDALSHIANETAAGLKQSLAAGQPATTKLIVASLADRLRDEYVVADLVQRSIAGENAFLALLREIIREEAGVILQARLAGVQEAA